MKEIMNITKQKLIEMRTEFFEAIYEQIKKPPTRIDDILQQQQYYVAPDLKQCFYDPEAGDFAICINGEFFEKNFTIYYSLWQLGEMLRIGVKIEDEELQGAFASDTHNEVFYIWGMKNDPRVDVAHGSVFYDWEFEVPALYDSYKNQERFILGTRHMHFRVMRIIHDECQRLYFSKNREELYSNHNGNKDINEFNQYIDE
jgi:hypothetical protein